MGRGQAELVGASTTLCLGGSEDVWQVWHLAVCIHHDSSRWARSHGRDTHDASQWRAATRALMTLYRSMTLMATQSDRLSLGLPSVPIGLVFWLGTRASRDHVSTSCPCHRSTPVRWVHLATHFAKSPRPVDPIHCQTGSPVACTVADLVSRASHPM